MPQPNELPGPNSDFWDWQMHGVCRGVDSSVFFHPTGSAAAPAPSASGARRSCAARAPFLAQCRSHAISVAEPYGIWGGLSESERAALAAKSRVKTSRIAG